MRARATGLKRVRRGLSRVVAFFDGLLYPERIHCLCCSRALSEEDADGLCFLCREDLRKLIAREEEIDAERDEPLPLGVDYVSAAFPYEDQARTLVLRLKFGGIRAAAMPLASAMTMLPGGEEELIVPAPTTKRRLKSRGFNHSALIAEQIADMLGMPYAEALERTDDAQAQSTLRAWARKRNLMGSMRADARVAGKRVLLVDDVFTTGSTVAEASRALTEAGAKGVGVFVATRTNRRFGRRRGRKRAGNPPF